MMNESDLHQKRLEDAKVQLSNAIKIDKECSLKSQTDVACQARSHMASMLARVLKIDNTPSHLLDTQEITAPLQIATCVECAGTNAVQQAVVLRAVS